jgi:hypothetical protein
MRGELLGAGQTTNAPQAGIVVVENFDEELKRRVSTK